MMKKILALVIICWTVTLVHSPVSYTHLDVYKRQTQKLVHQILLEPTTNYYGTHEKWEKPYIGKIFNTTPPGYLKEMDDDAGTMSSWRCV